MAENPSPILQMEKSFSSRVSTLKQQGISLYHAVHADTMPSESLTGVVNSQLDELRKKIAGELQPKHVSKLMGDVSLLSPSRQKLVRLVEDQNFEMALGVAIVFNIVLIIAETDATADDGPSPVWVASGNICLLVIYMLELLLRLLAYHCDFFKDAWNVMDFCVIGSDIVFLSLDLAGFNMPKVTILRVFRLARISRTFKLLRQFKELNYLLQGFANAIKAILWGITLILIVLVVWAILAVQLIDPVNKDLDGFWMRNPCERCPHAFHTVFYSFLTFYQTAVAGDSWGLLSLPIIEASPLTSLFFLCVLVTVSLAIMNLIVAVVVERAQSKHAETVESLAMRKKEAYAEASMELLQLCLKLDKDGSGRLSKQEILTGFETHDFKAAMEVMGLRKHDMGFLFEALDTDRSGDVSYIEFVDHLFRYRNANEETLLFETKKLTVHVQQLQSMRNRRLALVESRKADLRELNEALAQLVALEDEATQSPPGSPGYQFPAEDPPEPLHTPNRKPSRMVNQIAPQAKPDWTELDAEAGEDSTRLPADI